MYQSITNMKQITILILAVSMVFLPSIAFGEIYINNGGFIDTESSYKQGGQVYFANHSPNDITINILGEDHIATSGNSYLFKPQQCGNIDYNIIGLGQGTLNIICQEGFQPIIPEIETIVEPTNSTNTSNSTDPEPTQENNVIENNTQENNTPEPIQENNQILQTNIGGHDLSISINDYQGTKKLVVFTGYGFLKSETLDIVVLDVNNTSIANAETIVTESGMFSVPSIVETSTLYVGDYNMTINGLTTNLGVIASWNGTDFSLTNQTSTSYLSSGNWTSFIDALNPTDKMDLIRAVLQYLLS